MNASLNVNRLEQERDVFLERVSPKEAEILETTVGDLRDYMQSLNRGSFLIAGVGSVLRFEDPSRAKDIDLAVVGFKYAPIQEHSLHDVSDFTDCVHRYFKGFSSRLGGKKVNLLEGSDSFSMGSGVFDLDEEIRISKEDLSLEIRTNLDSFGWYNSKGLQVNYLSEVRAIDIQFVFNQNPDEWRKEQERLRDSPTARALKKADAFFYSVLHEQV